VMFKTKIISSRVVEAFRAKLNNRGESIMEVLVSFMIFAILLTTAVAVVRSALVITGEQIARATTAQDLVNDLVGLDDSALTEVGVIEFSIGGTSVSSTHAIVYADDDFVVFRPDEP